MNEISPNVFAQNGDYTIYQMGNDSAGIFFACVPNDLKPSISIYIDLNKKSDIDLYKEIKDPLKKQELLDKLSEVNKMVNGMNKSGIYVLPPIDTRLIESKLDENAKISDYQEAFKIITNCTKEIYSRLNSTTDSQRTINQVIKIVEETESNKQFVEWLKKEGYQNFVEGITLEDLKKIYNTEVDSLAAPTAEKAEENKTIESSASLSNVTIASAAEANVQSDNTIPKEEINQPVVAAPIPQPVATSSIEQPTVAPIAQAPTQTPSGIAPVDHTYDNVPTLEQSQQKVLVRKPPMSMAGFVKFPIFLLTITAIGSIGVFVGKLVYMYLSR